MGFVVAGSPYIPRFVEKISGHKKQTPPTYPTYNISKYGPKSLGSNDKPNNSSWIALRGQDEMPFDGLVKPARADLPPEGF